MAAALAAAANAGKHRREGNEAMPIANRAEVTFPDALGDQRMRVRKGLDAGRKLRSDVASYPIVNVFLALVCPSADVAISAGLGDGRLGRFLTDACRLYRKADHKIPDEELPDIPVTLGNQSVSDAPEVTA